MNIKVYGSELNRMMKTVIQCIDPKSQKLGNVEVIYDNNLLSVRGTNGSMSAVMSTPVLGGTGESFCVDGTMFARVCSMCNGEISISSDGKTCTVRGVGRTRLPIVNETIPAFERVTGKECSVKAERFARGYGSVAYAMSTDQSRIVLTGVLIESTEDGIRMVSIDGFKMAIEYVDGESEDMKIIVPGAFMKLVSASAASSETVTLRTDGKKIEAVTDGMMVSCSLLSGDFPDYNRILPKEFKTECLVATDAIQGALKSGSVVNSGNNLVKLVIDAENVTVMSNSEQADFDAEVPCSTHGDALKIAFNHKFMMETIASIGTCEISMMFNSPISPCVVKGKEGKGCRLILPVRVAG